MKLPRDLDGPALVKALAKLGYHESRRSGSHIRLSCDTPRPHHVTVPAHRALRVGTLAAILSEVASHHRLEREALLHKLFG